MQASSGRESYHSGMSPPSSLGVGRHPSKTGKTSSSTHSKGYWHKVIGMFF